MIFEKFFERTGEKRERWDSLEVSINKTAGFPYKIQITRSRNRRRTISARVSGETMLVHAPGNISDSELRKVIDNFAARFKKRKLKEELKRTQDLREVARQYNKEYFGGSLEIAGIEYSAYQDKRFGCCDYRKKKILISHRLRFVPAWVRDYVIIHELAHLAEPNHGKNFWDIVHRYKLAERAIGYLLAVGFAEDDSGGVAGGLPGDGSAANPA